MATELPLRRLLWIHIRHRKLWVVVLVLLLLVLCTSAVAIDYIRIIALQGVLAPLAQAHNLPPSLLRTLGWLCYIGNGSHLLLVVGLVWWYLAAASALRPDEALQLTTSKRNAAKAYMCVLYSLVYSTAGLLLIPSVTHTVTEAVIWLAIRSRGQIVGTSELAGGTAAAAILVLAVELLVPLSLLRIAFGFQMLLGVVAVAAPSAVGLLLLKAVWFFERSLSDETAMLVMIVAAAVVVTALVVFVRLVSGHLCLAQMAGDMRVDRDNHIAPSIRV